MDELHQLSLILIERETIDKDQFERLLAGEDVATVFPEEVAPVEPPGAEGREEAGAAAAAAHDPRRRDAAAAARGRRRLTLFAQVCGSAGARLLARIPEVGTYGSPRNLPRRRTLAARLARTSPARRKHEKADGCRGRGHPDRAWTDEAAGADEVDDDEHGGSGASVRSTTVIAPAIRRPSVPASSVPAVRAPARAAALAARGRSAPTIANRPRGAAVDREDTAMRRAEEHERRNEGLRPAERHGARRRHHCAGAERGDRGGCVGTRNERQPAGDSRRECPEPAPSASERTRPAHGRCRLLSAARAVRAA